MAKKKTIKFKGIEFEEVEWKSEYYHEDYGYFIIDKKYYYFIPKKKKPKKCSKCGQVVKG